MGLVATLILVLATAWVLQAFGTWYQMRHYRDVLGGITREGVEGFVGVGNAKAQFGKGVILILVVDGDGVVTKALRMRGRTVFSRFREAEDLVGTHVDGLRDAGEGPYDKGTMTAVRRAVEQIDRIRSEKAEREVEVGVG